MGRRRPPRTLRIRYVLCAKEGPRNEELDVYKLLVTSDVDLRELFVNLGLKYYENYRSLELKEWDIDLWDRVKELRALVIRQCHATDPTLKQALQIHLSRATLKSALKVSTKPSPTQQPGSKPRKVKSGPKQLLLTPRHGILRGVKKKSTRRV